MANELAQALASLGGGISKGVEGYYDGQDYQRQLAEHQQAIVQAQQDRQRKLAQEGFDRDSGMLDRAIGLNNQSLAAALAPKVMQGYKDIGGGNLGINADKYGLGDFMAPTVQKTQDGRDYSPVNWQDGGVVPTATHPDMNSLRSLSRIFTTPHAPKIEHYGFGQSTVTTDPYTNQQTFKEGQFNPNTYNPYMAVAPGGVVLDKHSQRPVYTNPAPPPPVQYVTDSSNNLVGLPSRLNPGQTPTPIKTDVTMAPKGGAAKGAQMSADLRKLYEAEYQHVLDEVSRTALSGGSVPPDSAIQNRALANARRKLTQQVSAKGADAKGLMTDASIEASAKSTAATHGIKRVINPQDPFDKGHEEPDEAKYWEVYAKEKSRLLTERAKRQNNPAGTGSPNSGQSNIDAWKKKLGMH